MRRGRAARVPMRGCVGALVAKLRRSPPRHVEADEAPVPRAPGTAALGCLAVQEDDLPKIYKKLEPRRDEREKRLSQGAR